MIDEFFDGEINKKNILISLLSILIFFGLKVGFFILILYYINHNSNTKYYILTASIVFLIIFIIFFNIIRTRNFYNKDYDKKVLFIIIKVVIAFLTALSFYFLERKNYTLMVVFGSVPVLVFLILLYNIISKIIKNKNKKTKIKNDKKKPRIL